MTRHQLPNGPCQVLDIDLMKAGPIPEIFFVVMHYYSRCTEIEFLKSSTPGSIFWVSNDMFVSLGISKSIRSDNLPPFVSSELQQFYDIHNVQLIHTHPYWPQANGEVKNMNRSILKILQISHLGPMRCANYFSVIACFCSSSESKAMLFKNDKNI